MKQIAILFLILALAGATALAEESGKAQVYYAGVTAEKHPDRSNELVQVHSITLGAFWLDIAASGLPAKDYYRNGVRFTLSETPPEGGYGTSDNDLVIVPATVDIIGELYGEVVDSDWYQITVRVSDNGVLKADSPVLQLAITDNTYQMRSYLEGDPIRIIYDDDTLEALELIDSNG